MFTFPEQNVSVFKIKNIKGERKTGRPNALNMKGMEYGTNIFPN